MNVMGQIVVRQYLFSLPILCLKWPWCLLDSGFDSWWILQSCGEDYHPGGACREGTKPRISKLSHGIHGQLMSSVLYVCMLVCMYVHTNVCILCLHICMFLCMCVCMCVYVWVYIYTHTYTYIHMCVCVYIYIYIYINEWLHCAVCFSFLHIWAPLCESILREGSILITQSMVLCLCIKSASLTKWASYNLCVSTGGHQGGVCSCGENHLPRGQLGKALHDYLRTHTWTCHRRHT
jgi:hypothetical protein